MAISKVNGNGDLVLRLEVDAKHPIGSTTRIIQKALRLLNIEYSDINASIG